MTGSLSRAKQWIAVAITVATVSAGCKRQPPAATPPRAPQVSGTVQLNGLRAAVTITRDSQGIPHIVATNTDDLFFAQGFVQAQDRLFQMDLWKRAAQGRLAEVLGANFVQRDSMTRRIQFRGNPDREWESYGADARTIATAFTSGINAWVRIARADLPEDFALAGWAPESWRPEDLLNRTDAYLASSGGQDELLRARLVAALGPSRVDRLMPLPDGQRSSIDSSTDLSAISFVVPDALRRIGTPPFFLTLADKVTDAKRPGQQQDVTAVSAARLGFSSSPDLPPTGAAWAIGRSRSITGGPTLAVSAAARFSAPSQFYLVHLQAPGWNAIGATRPWLPGVVIGHNDRIAWTLHPVPVDTQDVFIEHVNPANRRQVQRDGRWVDMSIDYERVAVKGREQPVQYERQYTSNGVVIAQDTERNLVYTLRWTGTEPGGAGELAALAFNRSQSWSEFREALARWKTPVSEFVYADIDGTLATGRAGLLPVRGTGHGSIPNDATVGAHGWQGVRSLSETASAASSTVTSVVAAGGNASRAARISQWLDEPGSKSADNENRFLKDTLSLQALSLVRLLPASRALPQQLQPLRTTLATWDGRMEADSAGAALFTAWESRLRQLIAERSVPDDLRDEVRKAIDVESILTRPTGADAIGSTRDTLLVDALLAVASDPAGATIAPAAQPRTLIFEHPLAVFDPAKRRFNVGPVPMRGGPDTVFFTDGRRGAVLEMVLDLSDWNRSTVSIAPGQSGSPASPHYDDLAARWAAGEAVPLLFDGTSTTSPGKDVLTLQPAR